MSDPILDSLNVAQREAVTYQGQHLLVFAGPGTGKTRVITHRIAYLTLRQGLDPEAILAITFTNKAALEMKIRLGNLLGEISGRPWTGTFHAFSLWLLRRHWREGGLPKDFVIYDSEDQRTLMREILTSREIPAAKAGVYLDVISRLKDDLMDAKSYAIHADMSGDAHRSALAKIYLAYQEGLKARSALDFGDLLLEANLLFKQNPGLAVVYQERFPSIFADEYQDINRSQYALIKALAGDKGTLTAVADDDQVIYEWRNANPKYTLEFEKEFPNAHSIVLSENYRSSPNVLGPASKLIRHNKVRKDKELTATRPQGEAPEVLVAEDERLEAKMVARRVRGLLDSGVPPAQVAVFYRLNAQSRNLEIEMRALGIPYRIIGSVGFYARREIKDILAMARLLVTARDEISLWRILTNYPKFSLTKEALSRLKAWSQEHRSDAWAALVAAGSEDMLSSKAQSKIARFLEVFRGLQIAHERSAPLAELFEAIARETGYLEDSEEEDRALNAWELVQAAREFHEQNPQTDLAGFLSHTSLLASVSADNQAGRAVDTVSLMTIHLAKGLEFRAVCLTGVEEGLLPFKISHTNPGELEEERRLFYVGMTRAKDYLVLSRAKSRVLFGSESPASPSRFLFEAGLAEGDWPARPVLRRGSRIKHPMFGEGRVVALSGSGQEMKATVQFERGSIRKFLVNCAPLEVL